MNVLTLSRNRKKTAWTLVVVCLLGAIWLGWREIPRTPSLGTEVAWGASWPDFEGDDFFISRWIDPDASASESVEGDGYRPQQDESAISGEVSGLPTGSRTGAMKSTDGRPALALGVVDRDQILESVFGDADEEGGKEADGAIDSAIQTCARSRSLDLVFDSSFHVGGGPPFVFTGDRVVDLTDEVIATLRKQAYLSAKRVR
jgi:hypothetical protein